MLQINEAFYHVQGKDLFVQRKHSHNEIEIIQVVNGNGTVIKNDATFELKSQYIYVIDARNTHIVYPKPDDCRDYIRNKIVIDADSFELFCKSIGIYDFMESLFSSAPISTQYNPNIDLLYKEIFKLFNSDKTEEIGFANGYIVELLYWIYLNREKNEQHLQDSTIQRVLNIISEKKGITSLDEISQELYLNKFYVCHVFKNKTGRNISDYISDKRFEIAVKMLKEGSLSVEDIAFECGFSSASSFGRFFKNKSGVSPSKFRKGNV